MKINIDRIATGTIIIIGGHLYKKVSPMICVSIETEELLYDARLYYKNAEPPMVEYVGRQYND